MNTWKSTGSPSNLISWKSKSEKNYQFCLITGITVRPTQYHSWHHPSKILHSVEKVTATSFFTSLCFSLWFPSVTLLEHQSRLIFCVRKLQSLNFVLSASHFPCKLSMGFLRYWLKPSSNGWIPLCRKAHKVASNRFLPPQFITSLWLLLGKQGEP